MNWAFDNQALPREWSFSIVVACTTFKTIMTPLKVDEVRRELDARGIEYEPEDKAPELKEKLVTSMKGNVVIAK